MVVHGGVVVVAPSMQVVVDIGGGHPWVVGARVIDAVGQPWGGGCIVDASGGG